MYIIGIIFHVLGIDVAVLTNNDSRIRNVLQDLFSSVGFKAIIVSNEEGERIVFFHMIVQPNTVL